MKNSALKNITIHFPILYDIQIQKLIKLGIYPSRSEIVRIAVRELLQKDLEFLSIISKDTKIIKKEVNRIRDIALKKDKLKTIFIPKAKREQVERLLVKLGIGF